jgi:catechol 2,3-dioxygenase-like lactoylglutathione lyase family enzyme
MSYKIGKLKEVIVSVTNMKRHLETWHDYMGWDVRYQGPINTPVLHSWHLKSSVSGYEVLCGFPNASSGLLRLVKFNNVEQRQIRGGAQIWEPGGIFDFDLRVTNIQKTFNDLVNGLGWFSYGEPLELNIGPFQLNESLIYGPDRVAIALVDRIQPPLEGFPEHNGIRGSIYLSVTVARNLEESIAFFVGKLGFVKQETMQLLNQEPAPTVFRTPWNFTTQYPVHLAALSPDGTRDTLIELFSFEGFTGGDYGDRAVPPNIGILMYRFDVQGIEDYYQTLQSRCVQITTPLTELEILPYGRCKSFALRSPDGVWMEFIERMRVAMYEG